MLISDLHDLNEAVKWCDTCRPHVNNSCDDCHAPFLPSEPHYRSQSFHYHPAAISGVSGARAVQKELCVDCYRKDHANVHGEGTVPDLPDRGVDPRFHAAQKREEERKEIYRIIESVKNYVPVAEYDERDNALLLRMVEVGLRFA